ncbi:MAG: hydroxyacid dehydrogenase [Candidatus Bathyarchaeota archaeon]|nr:hydroxyacid dehydrogenase [Candidatus Bathyarchaeota archaeon]
MSFTVIVTEPINKMGIEYLKERDVNVIELPPGSNENTLALKAGEAHGLITRGSIKITRSLMEQNPRLKAIGVHGIGCDHVDLEAARELGRVVCNTPDALTVTVAEMAMALTLALLRNVVSADKAVRAGEWSRKYSDLIGAELAGKKVGIIGLGRIGEATAHRMQAFGAEIAYWSRTRKPEKEKEYGFQWMTFDELIRWSEIISIHIPATSETMKLISAKHIASMRDGVYIVNTARGKVIDEEALIEALRSGKIRGAALDVFMNEPLSTDSPLCEMDNVILTPHLGASNLEGMQRMALQVAEGVLKVLNGDEPGNRVV